LSPNDAEDSRDAFASLASAQFRQNLEALVQATPFTTSTGVLNAFNITMIDFLERITPDRILFVV
jgi:hypothetical protein